jgi:ketosteroid isomerase-like protein
MITAMFLRLLYRRYAAMVDTDLDALDDLLSDDVIYTHSDASVDTRSPTWTCCVPGGWCIWR